MKKMGVLKMTIIDYYDNIATSVLNEGAIVYFSDYSFFEKYYRDIDNYIRFNFDSYELLKRITDKSDIANEVQQRVYYCLLANQYKLQGLYETTQFEYNPLWNVDGTTTTERDSKTDDTNTTKNTGSNTTTIKSTDTDDKTTANTTKTEDVTDKTVNVSSSNTSEVSDTLYLREKTTTEDTSTYDSTVKDDTTEKETYVKDSTNTETIDTSQNDDRDIIFHEKVTETRQGNIGVTKTTDLIASQRDIVDFDFLSVLCHMIVNCLTVGVF